MRLNGKSAIVTGGASGFGAGIVRRFILEGARVVIADINGDAAEAMAEELGDAAFGLQVDVSSNEDVAQMVKSTIRSLGGIDILVNNAGGTFQAPFEDVSERGQQALVDLNFTSVTHWVRASLPHMRDRSGDQASRENGSSIVNITSIEAHRAAPGYAVYAAMKAAVVNLTKSLALELGDRNIRVNCVAPDMIPTPGTGPMDYDTPLSRRGHVDDVAGAVLYLVSPLAAFVTGSTIHVDGGNFAAGGWHRNDGSGFDLG